MRNFYLVRDEDITFAVKVQQPNELNLNPPLESFFTPWGFVIPLTVDGFALHDYLETGEWPWVTLADGPLGAILTHDGKLYDFFVTEKGFFRRRALYGKGGTHVRAYRYAVEEAVQASLVMGGTTDEVVRRVEQTQIMIAGTYVTLSTTHLCKMLNEKYPNPIPLSNKACPRPGKEEEKKE
ncbi:hypothetical protein CF95_gp116 [Erwinia phage PhiEaH1]|uniref:Uncharacterized protein n=1 Tax=Erwinia phage PhiEaH1 TaxID=1401669 RepID=W8D0H8_9CAUD|nr:hypothetical protein CF95_gp116 [Erwinia phage PhiEaH1]AGX01838.1 hypothetical protein [Erwinia phage PhiEaH1]